MLLGNDNLNQGIPFLDGGGGVEDDVPMMPLDVFEDGGSNPSKG